ncbi:MAG: GNAT family N-acetyltransferase, partial [Actinomycetota bacterium]|nr:GNAT family N-acetyltransferase [Actinomycetota bacterium]
MTEPDLQASGRLTLRRGTPHDTRGICALLAAAFPDNPKRDADVYRWQYWDNPFGPPVVWVWEDGGAIVCHGAVFAAPGLLGGRAVVLGHTADAATAVPHRGSGLFARLTRARFEDAPRKGMAVSLSLPNPKSLPGVVQAGLHPVARVAAYVLPLDDAWL